MLETSWPLRGRVTALTGLLAILLLVPAEALTAAVANRLLANASSRDTGQHSGWPALTDISTTAFGAFFAVQAVTLVLLAIVMSRRIIGWTLRPVEAIGAELTAIDGDDLGTRVHEPPGDDEISRLARTINRTLDRLQHAEGLVELTLDRQRQFASDASHELRTPVAGLRAQLEEARMHPGETDLDELLGRSLRDVDRLQAIIADLLLLAEVRADEPDPLRDLDLSETIRTEVGGRVSRHAVRLRLAPGVTVRAVHPQIVRMVANLLDNAERHARGAVLVTVRPCGRAAELIVSDDGNGIGEAGKERIFEPFARLDTARSRDRGGTGLGLAIARDIVQVHGGSIEACASAAGGAAFVVRLPLTRPTGRAAERPAAHPRS